MSTSRRRFLRSSAIAAAAVSVAPLAAADKPAIPAPSDDPLGVTGSTDNDDGTVTIRYGCGYSWTGTPPGPSRCPICSRETVSTETNPGTGGDSSDDAGPGEEGPGEPTEEADEPPAGDPYIRDIIEYDE